jgi:hypothetical protein
LLLNYKNADSAKTFYVQRYPVVADQNHYSLFCTISHILYDKSDNAKLLKFAVSYFYDVISRLDDKHPFF